MSLQQAANSFRAAAALFSAPNSRLPSGKSSSPPIFIAVLSERLERQILE
jgi:hypothetical protein